MVKQELDAIACLERLRIFMHDEYDRCELRMTRAQCEAVKEYADLMEELIDDIKGSQNGS